MSGDAFQFKITILGISPPIWRRILVPVDFTFYEFHVAIQDAMGWKHRRPYAFLGLPNAQGLQICRPQPVGQAPLSTIDYKIGDYLKLRGDKTIYEYDSFQHMIEFEYVCLQTNVPRPLKCVGGERACPPDGTGGAAKYQSYMAMMTNPNHPEYSACIIWLISAGGPFNPENFDPDSVVFSDAQTRFFFTPY